MTIIVRRETGAIDVTIIADMTITVVAAATIIAVVMAVATMTTIITEAMGVVVAIPDRRTVAATLDRMTVIRSHNVARGRLGLKVSRVLKVCRDQKAIRDAREKWVPVENKGHKGGQGVRVVRVPVVCVVPVENKDLAECRVLAVNAVPVENKVHKEERDVKVRRGFQAVRDRKETKAIRV